MQTTQSASVSARIRGIAAENRATQEDLAKIVGVSRAAIVRRLNGSSDWRVLELIAIAAKFDVPVATLFPATLSSPVSTSPEVAETGDPHDARRPVPDRAAGVTPVRRAS